MVKTAPIRSRDQSPLFLPLISAQAYGSRKQRPVIDLAYQSAASQERRLPGARLSSVETIRSNPPPTTQSASLASLATFRNNIIPIGERYYGIGIRAYGHMGIWAYGHMGIWAYYTIGISHYDCMRISA
jgi:hypothetical protein